MILKPLDIKDLPESPSLKKIIGPSFIILGLGLGSGEIILWPYLTSKFGMGVIWGALIGLTFQFFMNMEIERYALAHGESVFVGFARKLKILPFWFLLSTFIPWVWPGIVASSAKFYGHVFGLTDTKFLAIILLVVMGLILTLGPILYKTVENLQKILIVIGVPTIFILSIILARANDWIALSRGAIGLGEGYFLLPAGIPIASFLAALAYAGAGGNLNLAQSFYIKEKGYGMGKYAGRITSLLTGKKEEVSLTGSKFVCDERCQNIFKKWWKNINTEHFLIFWVTGSITILLLGLLSYTTTHGFTQNVTDIDFVFMEAKEIGTRIFPFAGIFFLLVAGSTLFGTQLTVFDATSRILTENTILSSNGRLTEKHISKVYYIVLWLQILAGITIFMLGFTQPLQLLTLAAVLNAFAMFIHTGLTLWLNLTSLDKPLRPSLFRVSAMVLAFLFYGGFSLFTIYDKFF
ncbi:MAG: Nramp family divalent metal transporter [Patescibacteria group bacterium]